MHKHIALLLPGLEIYKIQTGLMSFKGINGGRTCKKTPSVSSLVFPRRTFSRRKQPPNAHSAVSVCERQILEYPFSLSLFFLSLVWQASRQTSDASILTKHYPEHGHFFSSTTNVVYIILSSSQLTAVNQIEILLNSPFSSFFLSPLSRVFRVGGKSHSSISSVR